MAPRGLIGGAVGAALGLALMLPAPARAQSFEIPGLPAIPGMPGFDAGPPPDPGEVARRTWARFQQTCGAVLSDPQAYLNGVPNPGPSGQQTIAASPDNLIVSVNVQRDGGLEEVQLMGLPGSLVVMCSVHEFDPEGMMALGQLALNDQYFVNYSAQLASALAAAVQATPQAVIVGGQVPLLWDELGAPAGPGGTLDGYQAAIVNAQHLFGIRVPLGGSERSAYAEVHMGGLFIGTFLQELSQ